jgi:hypothetical protein
MLHLEQGKADEAIKALRAVAASTCDQRGLLVYHPARAFSYRKWQAIVCGLIASHSDGPSGVMLGPDVGLLTPAGGAALRDVRDLAYVAPAEDCA